MKGEIQMGMNRWRVGEEDAGLCKCPGEGGVQKKLGAHPYPRIIIGTVLFSSSFFKFFFFFGFC